MLIARGETTVGKGSLSWAVAFAAQFRLSTITRTGLVVDTSFVPPATRAPGKNPCLYILLTGTWRSSTGLSFEGPCALVTSHMQLDGAAGVRAFTYRADGAPFSVVEIHIDAGETSLRPAEAPYSIELDPATWSAARRLSEASRESEESANTAVLGLLAALAERSIVTRRFAKNAARPVPPPLRILWKAVGPMVERLILLPSVKDVRAATGATPREIDRYVRTFLTSFGMVGEGWREASRHWRLRVAILFLSAEGASIAEIARVVGYGSTDAMTRAFRDEGLPSPGAVREQITLAAATTDSPDGRPLSEATAKP
jgi:AraC-like DNA-binding protein